MLCRITVYVIVLGAFALPAIILAMIPGIPPSVVGVVAFACVAGFLTFAFRNFTLLMGIDFCLTTIHCTNTARLHFTLPSALSPEKVEKRVARFGKMATPVAESSILKSLRYRYSRPVTVYNSGVEKVIVTYRVNSLDDSLYRSILRSASGNSEVLKGKKCPRAIMKAQKKANLNRVTVILIYADHVEDSLATNLFTKVGKQGGDGFETAFLPCVLDFEKRICTFDSVRIPFLGFGYPVKNRGIRLIRKLVFGGRFPYNTSPDRLSLPKDTDPEMTLFSLWKQLKAELIGEERQQRKIFTKLSHCEIFRDDLYLYLKWEDRGVCLSVESDKETRIAMVDFPNFWTYPKSNPIAKATAHEMKRLIESHFAECGYAVQFIHEEAEDNPKKKKRT